MPCSARKSLPRQSPRPPHNALNFIELRRLPQTSQKGEVVGDPGIEPGVGFPGGVTVHCRTLQLVARRGGEILGAGGGVKTENPLQARGWQAKRVGTEKEGGRDEKTEMGGGKRAGQKGRCH